MAFRIRRGKLRGSTNSRLREGITVPASTVSPGAGVAGVTPGVRTSTTMNPAPRPRVHMAQPGVTPIRHSVTLKKGPVVVSTGRTSPPRPATARPSAAKATTATAPASTRTTAPETQKRAVQGVPPDLSSPETIRGPTVPDQAIGIVKPQKSVVVPKNRR